MKDKEAIWSKKYKEREKKLGQMEEFISENLSYIRGPKILDLACGDGRNAIGLARLGYSVTGVDFSEEALKRLGKFMKEENLSVDTIKMDLENIEKVKTLGSYNTIVISRYKPSDEVFKLLKDLLEDGGTFLYTSFNISHHLENGFPRKFTLRDGELLDLDLGLKNLKYQKGTKDNAYIDGYIFQK